jgi:hypothetical protein
MLKQLVIPKFEDLLKMCSGPDEDDSNLYVSASTIFGTLFGAPSHWPETFEVIVPEGSWPRGEVVDRVITVSHGEPEYNTEGDLDSVQYIGEIVIVIFNT